jgi:hypothetical protein
MTLTRLYLTAIAFLAVIIASLLGVSYANAQVPENCGPPPDVTAGLARNYGEIVIAMGVSSNGNLVEIFAAPSGTFTIVITAPGGLSCIGVAGANFVAAELPPQGTPG